MASHGEALVAALLASGRYCVIYRPHPLTGITEGNVGLADILLRAMVRETAAVDPVADHRVDIDRDFAESAAASDLLICDVSGVSVDYLPIEACERVMEIRDRAWAELVVRGPDGR